MPAPRLLARRIALALAWALMGLGTLLILLYAVPQLQLRHRYAAMVAAFIPYGVLAWLAAGLLFVTAGKRWLKLIAFAAAAGLIVQVIWAYPYWPRSAPRVGAGGFTVVTFNLRCKTVNLDDLSAEVIRTQPTVVLLQDVDQQAHDVLQRAAWPLPYRASLITHTDEPGSPPASCRTVVFSTSPLSHVPVTPASLRQDTLRTELPSGPLIIIPVDVANPSEGVAGWAADLTAVQQAVTALGEQPLIAVGDFNAVLEHLPMRRLQQLGLTDAAAQAGAGWQPTFPASGLPPLIAIDHVLISRHLTAASVTTFEVGDGDHLGLIAQLRGSTRA